MALMEIREVSKHFGGLAALDHVDIVVHDSQILGLIGPNGAGKTTLFDIVSGFYTPSNGKVIFRGENITGLRIDQVAKKGIGRTFQASILLMQLTVFDNMLATFHMNFKEAAWKAFLHTPAAKKEELAAKQRITEMLDFIGLALLKDELAMNLPCGYQRALGVCMALATNPRLMLLDEPLTGMNPVETKTMGDLIKRIRDSGVTIIIIEHNMKAVMSLCDRIVVLSQGKKIAEGLPNEIRKNKEVIEAYLGG